MKLLTKGSTNAKTVKNSMTTYILYLSPHTQNDKGRNLCPHASPGCIAACLYTAGRGKMTSVQEARTRKSNYFVSDKISFLIDLLSEINTYHNTAVKRGEKVLFRLNGTSDVDFIYLIKKHLNQDVLELPNAYFYDYTKIPERALRYNGNPKYTVTFSRAETGKNQKNVVPLLEQGVNVAVVFNGDLPKTYLGFPVIDGDQSDIVMLYNRGAVLGLKAKGDAKKDSSGFVVDVKTLSNLNPVL